MSNKKLIEALRAESNWLTFGGDAAEVDWAIANSLTRIADSLVAVEEPPC